MAQQRQQPNRRSPAPSRGPRQESPAPKTKKKPGVLRALFGGAVLLVLIGAGFGFLPYYFKTGKLDPREADVFAEATKRLATATKDLEAGTRMATHWGAVGLAELKEKVGEVDTDELMSGTRSLLDGLLKAPVTTAPETTPAPGSQVSATAEPTVQVAQAPETAASPTPVTLPTPLPPKPTSVLPTSPAPTPTVTTPTPAPRPIAVLEPPQASATVAVKPAPTAPIPPPAPVAFAPAPPKNPELTEGKALMKQALEHHQLTGPKYPAGQRQKELKESTKLLRAALEQFDKAQKKEPKNQDIEEIMVTASRYLYDCLKRQTIQ